MQAFPHLFQFIQQPLVLCAESVRLNVVSLTDLHYGRLIVATISGLLPEKVNDQVEQDPEYGHWGEGWPVDCDVHT
jgi:hypothetical protein